MDVRPSSLYNINKSLTKTNYTMTEISTQRHHSSPVCEYMKRYYKFNEATNKLKRLVDYYNYQSFNEFIIPLVEKVRKKNSILFK